MLRPESCDPRGISDHKWPCSSLGRNVGEPEVGPWPNSRLLVQVKLSVQRRSVSVRFLTFGVGTPTMSTMAKDDPIPVATSG